MTKSIALRVLCAALFLVMIGWAPQSAIAQRGGHGGGGGGFHGGGGGGWARGGSWGGGSSWHGGGWSGGSAWRGGTVWRGGSVWRGGNAWGWGGWRGSGWRGGFWGSPGWGNSWAFSVGFNWGPSWGGFGSPFFFGPVWAPPFVVLSPAPVFVPATPVFVPTAPADFADSSSPNNDGFAYASSQSSNYVPDTSPAQQYRAPAPRTNAPAPPHPPAASSVTIRDASYTSPAPQYARAATATSSNYRPASSTARQLPPLRPEVQNVIRALRAMPPWARERQIDSGRYSNLTPQELQIVRHAADLPPA
ncbi:MAG TPA: hypothetical protein VKF84_08525 [Candidatus Sulfotelmatobacter sp.]|nr:hypothetical protein [Candidatus Sulfotelmatobacter sp.]